MTKLKCDKLFDLPKIAQELLPEILKAKNVSLVAPMGVGKTTFIKEICIALGVKIDEIHSPTYSLVNEYKGNELKIFHFDFYRLNNITEAYDFGLEEYFDTGALCLMEWADIVEPLIPLPYLKITIENVEETRIFTTEIINILQTK